MSNLEAYTYYTREQYDARGCLQNNISTSNLKDNSPSQDSRQKLTFTSETPIESAHPDHGSKSAKPRAILTSEQVIAIFRLKFDIKPCASAVARVYGISEKAIRDIWKGRTWFEETSRFEPTRPARTVGPPGRPKGRKDSAPRRRRLSTFHQKISTDACFDQTTTATVSNRSAAAGVVPLATGAFTSRFPDHAPAPPAAAVVGLWTSFMPPDAMLAAAAMDFNLPHLHPITAAAASLVHCDAGGLASTFRKWVPPMTLSAVANAAALAVSAHFAAAHPALPPLRLPGTGGGGGGAAGWVSPPRLSQIACAPTMARLHAILAAALPPAQGRGTVLPDLEFWLPRMSFV
jgi:hypothetical protein